MHTALIVHSDFISATGRLGQDRRRNDQIALIKPTNGKNLNQKGGKYSAQMVPTCIYDMSKSFFLTQSPSVFILSVPMNYDITLLWQANSCELALNIIFVLLSEIQTARLHHYSSLKQCSRGKKIMASCFTILRIFLPHIDT